MGLSDAKKLIAQEILKGGSIVESTALYQKQSIN
jgi:hypothetical protein